MNLISTSWSCQRCGAAFIGIPPHSGLCDPCAQEAEHGTSAGSPHQSLIAVCPDALATCSQCGGGPVCSRCGQRLVMVIPVSGEPGEVAHADAR